VHRLIVAVSNVVHCKSLKGLSLSDRHDTPRPLVIVTQSSGDLIENVAAAHQSLHCGRRGSSAGRRSSPAVLVARRDGCIGKMSGQIGA